MHQSSSSPDFWQAFMFWFKLGFISFGGPAGQIAIMHQELVERRRWLSEKRFLHALNYCMLLPGPEAQNGIIDRAFEVARPDDTRMHVKLLAIRRTHRLQSAV